MTEGSLPQTVGNRGIKVHLFLAKWFQNDGGLLTPKSSEIGEIFFCLIFAVYLRRSWDFSSGTSVSGGGP